MYLFLVFFSLAFWKWFLMFRVFIYHYVSTLLMNQYIADNFKRHRVQGTSPPPLKFILTRWMSRWRFGVAKDPNEKIVKYNFLILDFKWLKICKVSEKRSGSSQLNLKKYVLVMHINKMVEDEAIQLHSNFINLFPTIICNTMSFQ